MASESEQTKPRTKAWVRVLLAVSLALNLAIVGLVGGWMLRFGGTDGMRPPPRTMGEAMFRELPRADRRALWDGSNGSHKERHARQKAVALAFSEAVRAMPFDRSALESLVNEQVLQRSGFQRAVQRAWLIRVTEMTEAERLAYADRLERMLTRPWAKDRRERRP